MTLPSHYEVVTRYLTNAERSGRLIPGSAAIIGPKILAKQAGLDRDAGDSMSRLDDFLAGDEGRPFLDPRYKPSEKDTPLHEALKTFGVPADDASMYFNVHAASVLGYGASAGVAAFRILVKEGRYEHLGRSAEEQHRDAMKAQEEAARVSPAQQVAREQMLTSGRYQR